MVSAARLALVALITIQSIRGWESNHIYVYADPHAAVSSWQPVSCDGGVVAKIKKGTFFALTMASGRHTCAIADGTPTFVVVDPHRDIFLRVEEYVVVGEPRVLLLSRVAPDLARKEMRWLPYIPVKKVLASNVSVADPRTPEEPKFENRQKDQ
jgi:hypothetical protein